MMTNPRRTIHYPQLDGWRGYAALWIVLGHAVFLYNINFAQHPFLLFIGGSTFLAVDIFFIISGFVITEKLFADKTPVDWKEFMVKRTVRILPLYYITVFAVLIVYALVPDYTIVLSRQLPAKALNWTDVVSLLSPGRSEVLPALQESSLLAIKSPVQSFWPSLFLIQNFYPINDRAAMLNHTWFVALIVHFYIIYGLLAFLAARMASGREKQRTVMLAAATVLLLAVMMLRSHFGTSYVDYFQMTVFRLDTILFGCILSLAKDLPLGRWRRMVWSNGAVSAYFCAALAVLAVIIFRWPAVDPNRSPGIFTVSYVVFSLLIVSSMKENAFSMTVFGNRAITWIGRHAYGVYLFHFPFLFFYRWLSDRMHLATWFSISSFCLLSIAAGAGLQRLLDRAARGFLSRTAYS